MSCTKKNVAKAIMETHKSKDNPKARVDLAKLCDRTTQEMRPPRGGKTWKRPKAHFVLTPNKGGKYLNGSRH